jgi:hypothetical protein
MLLSSSRRNMRRRRRSKSQTCGRRDDFCCKKMSLKKLQKNPIKFGGNYSFCGSFCLPKKLNNYPNIGAKIRVFFQLILWNNNFAKKSCI